MDLLSVMLSRFSPALFCSGRSGRIDECAAEIGPGLDCRRRRESYDERFSRRAAPSGGLLRI